MRRTGWIGLWLGLGVAPGLGCGSTSVFQCQADAECGADGTCQPDVGYCSFPDDECPGGQRYGEHAGEGLSGTCVDAGGSSSTSAGETLGTGTGTDDGVDGTDSEGSCPGEAECVPLPPPGWEGPVLAVLGTGAAPPCPAGAPGELYLAQAGLVAEPAECACECGGKAEACDLTAYAALSGECTQDLGFRVMSGGCMPLDSSLVPMGTNVDVPATGGDACTGNVQQSVPPPAWTDEVRVCMGAPAGCGEGTCVPAAAAGEGVCIVREGEHTCPLSDYTQAFTFYRGADDTRGCSACECGGGVSCWLEVYLDDTCTGDPIYETSLDVDLCEAVNQIVPEGQTEPVGVLVQPMGGCEAVGIESNGAVVPTEPLTLCCRP